MADNKYSKIFGQLRLTTSFQDIYTAPSAGDGKTFAGNLKICPLRVNNGVSYDIQLDDGTTQAMELENTTIHRGSTDVIPLNLADGQKVSVRVKAVDTQLTVSGITAANPAVITVNSTTGLNQNTDTVVYIASIGGMTEIADGLYRVTVVSSTTVSLQTMAGVDVDSSAYTAYTSGGTIDIVPAFAIITGYEETITQE